VLITIDPRLEIFHVSKMAVPEGYKEIQQIDQHGYFYHLNFTSM
jgi:hypothetical protein